MIESRVVRTALYRSAAMVLHPDVAERPDRAVWNQLQDARRLLDEHGAAAGAGGAR